MVIGLLGVGRLTTIGHPSNGRDRTHIIVPAFVAPSGNRGIVHGATHGEIPQYIPVERGEWLTIPTPLTLQFWTIIDIVQ